ncbi:hypothetical protein [Corynebacterium casei]|uniref:hypothetical protein n=1 Tax=Corynebacterium casei TaxID=160386 RepID=UPI003FD3EA94
MGITSTFKSVCKDAGVELPEEFDSLAIERNNRIDVVFPIVENWREDYSRMVDLLKPIKDYGWKIEHAGGRFKILPPKDDNAEEADTVLSGKRKTVNSIHEVTKLLTGHVSEAWKGAKVIGGNKVAVPARDVSQHHQTILANNVKELEHAGWSVAANTNGLGLTNAVTHYELTAPLEYAPTDDVKIALARVLRLDKREAGWIQNGVATGRSIVFGKKAAGQSYHFALGHVRNLLARGWSIERREGLTQEVVITAPANALN